jgi:proline iminopeptidase
MQSSQNTTLNASGFLDVGGGHRIYWEDWGNRQVDTPIFFLHGGPGAGFKEKHKTRFDPQRQRVIFHDQRGAGKSVPFAELANNTTSDLVSDINLLRESLGFKKIRIAGGSWGSALALVYAISFPAHVEKMLLRSIFLARQEDLDYLFDRTVRYHFFPETRERLLSFVPPAERQNVIQFYLSKFNDCDPNVAKRYAREWCLYESSLAGLTYDAAEILRGIDNDSTFSYVALAKLEATYFARGCFLEENFILNNIRAISHIPCQIVHGLFDMVCSPKAARDLHQAMPASELHMLVGGHTQESSPEFSQVMTAYSRTFL